MGEGFEPGSQAIEQAGLRHHTAEEDPGRGQPRSLLHRLQDLKQLIQRLEHAGHPFS
jgi:hypothetical protein